MKKGFSRRIIFTRLKAFSSFSDNFSSSSIKSGWKILSGSWTSGSNTLSAGSVNSLITIPLSKSNATVTATIPSGTGVGIYFWGADSNNYWASYAVSSGNTVSTCSNNACSGTENYSVTQNCSCYDDLRTRNCSCSSVPVQVSTCNNGSCSGSENFTATRNCSCTTQTIYPSNCTNGECDGVEAYTATRSCTCGYSGGTCSYTPGSTTYNNMGCASAFSGCSTAYQETACNGPGGLNVCNCPCGVSRVCCYTTTVTSGSYNCATGCSYDGQYNSQCYFGSNCNNGSCSGSETYTAYRDCSCSAQQIQVSNCNNGSCSGSETYTGTRSCSCSTQNVQVSNCNSGACSGSENYYVSVSTCGSGACSGTYTYTATRNCSCTTTYNRKLRTIKVVNGVQTTVGEFNISSLPTSIQIVTSGTGVNVSSSGSSQGYTNSDGTTNKNFGIIRISGGSEEISSASAFTATVA